MSSVFTQSAPLTGGKCTPNRWKMHPKPVENAPLTGGGSLWENGSLQSLQSPHPLRGWRLRRGRRPGLPGFARPVSVRETQAHSRRRRVFIGTYCRGAGPTTGRLSTGDPKREQVQHTSESLALNGCRSSAGMALGPLRMGPALHVSRVPTPWTPRTPHPRAL